jgi:hypothetical protein
VTELAVLVPTRSRPHNVLPIIEAWSETGAFGVADLIFIIDRDDPKIGEYVDVIGQYPQVQRMFAQEWEPLVPKLNRVAVRAAIDYSAVAFMGDDHVPRTEMWAHKLIEDHQVRGARIVYGRDGLQDMKLCTWWSMDSRIICALGKMVPADVQHMYCDNAVMLLGRKIGSLGYDGRILIEHMHPLADKAPSDEQYERVNRREQYERDEVAFRAWVSDGLARDATLLADIWG